MPAQDVGLVAHYSFNEGTGSVLRDVSGNGNDGQIVGAQWIRRRHGYCLEFNGIDSYVDCGAGPALNLTEAITMEVWVLLDAGLGEAGITGKHFESYFLSYYADGKCYWYINQSGAANNVSTPVLPGCWHHLATTFDGVALSLYLDGKLAATQPLKSSAGINPGQHFFIGVTNPSNTAAPYLKGLVDELRVYNRAFSSNEIQEHFVIGEKQLEDLEYDESEAVATIERGRVVVGVAQDGQVRIQRHRQAFLVESSFSHPGTRIGWNHFAKKGRLSESGWSPSVTKTSSSSIEIQATGAFYALTRRVQIDNDRVYFEDHLTNTGTESVAFVIWHRLTGLKPFDCTLAPELAENPTVFLASEADALGMLMEDDISRLNYSPSIGLPANQARVRLSNMLLDRSKKYTMRWAVYLLAENSDYFDLVNRIRHEWKTDFKIDGPFAFFDANPLTNPLIGDPQGLKAYLERKRLKSVALSPWLDYDPGTFDHVLSRQEFKAVIQTAMSALMNFDKQIR